MRLRLLAFLLALLLALPPVSGLAQDDGAGPPLVVFIDDPALITSSVNDPGPDGLTRLAQMFMAQGAVTTSQDLTDPLPPDAQVIVLARPLRALPPDQLARLWVQLVRGSNLLLALDPVGLPTQRGEGLSQTLPERATGGLGTLLWQYYGIGLRDTFLVAPWFSPGSITSQDTTFFQVWPEDIVRHPVAEPLVDPALPVQVWGARSMAVEPFGMSNWAVPLLYTLSAYGEANLGVFSAQQPAPLEVNLGEDALGRVMLGALGENTRFGSRTVVLGDSELLQNGYGLDLATDGTPLYLGNSLLVERIAAWLLELPVDAWPALSPSYTWLALDGRAADWEGIPVLLPDDSADAFVTRYDIQGVRVFRDDLFLYVLVETDESPNPEMRMTLQFENNYDGVIDATVSVTHHEVVLLTGQGGETPVPDAVLAIGDALELRLPLRAIGPGALIGGLCLADSRTPTSSIPIDCTAQPLQVIPQSSTLSPIPLRHPPGPRVLLVAPEGSANLRSGPGTDFEVLDLVYNGAMFVPLGRNEGGDWIQVQNALFTGWLVNFTIQTNVDPATLPVVPP